ncbi:MAG: hypothetical protein ACRCX2_29835 [Paraclostridium sp.]
MPEVKLSPPWYIFRNEVAYTIGRTPGVVVDQLKEDGANYKLTVYVMNSAQAQAIRQIMKEEYSFGNVKVMIVVQDRQTGQIVPYNTVSYLDANAVANVFCTALKGNCLFMGIILTEGKLPPIQQTEVGNLVLVFGKCVVQFYNDDISDLCSNYNQVASYTFSQVIQNKFNPNFKVGTTTYDEKCIKYTDLYCRKC